MIQLFTQWDRPLLMEELKRIEDASKRGIPIEEATLETSKTQLWKRMLNLSSLLLLLFMCGNLEWAIPSWQLLMERYEVLPLACSRSEDCLPKITTRMGIYFSAYSICSALSILPFRYLRRERKIELLLALVGGLFTCGMGLIMGSKYLVIDPYLPAFMALGMAAAGAREAYHYSTFKTSSSGMLWAAGWMVERTGATVPMILLTNFKSALVIERPSLDTLLGLWTVAFTFAIVGALFTMDRGVRESIPEQTSRFPMKAPLLFKQSLGGQIRSWPFAMLFIWSTLIMLRLSLYPITAIEHYRANTSPNSKLT